jgi:hypothetical protein
MRSYILAVLMAGALLSLTAGCNRSNKSDDDAVKVKGETDASGKTAAMQGRLSGFFYTALVPKLQGCWNKVQGTGEIEFKFTYSKQGNNWAWQQQEVTHSTLPKGQESVALECMQSAASGTSFPLADNETSAALKTFEIHWSWPVPFPADTTELGRMISTGGGGRNPECPKTCADCVYNAGTHLTSCQPSCSGYVTCTPDGTGTGCRMTGGVCSSGWSGPWSGESYIARTEKLSVPR